MADYFNSNDLIIRRVQTADWTCAQTKKVANMVNYGQLVPKDYLNKLSYVIAAMEAIGCYVPITSPEEDGINNCLTEAEADKIFNNITEITGLHWQGKGVTYRNQLVEADELGQITSTVTLTGGGVIGISNPASASINIGQLS